MFISDIKASQVHLSYHQGKKSYVVNLSGNGNDLAQIELSPTALQSLVLQALASMPHLEPRYTVPDLAEAQRRPARILLEFDDRSIQLLMREVQSDALIDFLWYMKDAALIKRILENMSKRAAEMLMDDLNETWFGKNPDTVLDVFARRGQAAIAEIMSLCEKLIAEGQIPNFLEHLIPEETPNLTADQVDALLTKAADTEGKTE